MRVDHSRSDIAVAKEFMDGADVVVRLKQMRGKAVAEGMGRDTFQNLCLHNRPFDCLLQMRFMKIVAPFLSKSASKGACNLKGVCSIRNYPVSG
jgi:hypothetical protein